VAQGAIRNNVEAGMLVGQSLGLLHLVTTVLPSTLLICVQVTLRGLLSRVGVRHAVHLDRLILALLLSII
jgi:hypothetical protein